MTKQGRTHVIKRVFCSPELSTYEKGQLKKKIFYKLEKFYRLRQLEKALEIFEPAKKDPEQKLKAYMQSWEG